MFVSTLLSFMLSSYSEQELTILENCCDFYYPIAIWTNDPIVVHVSSIIIFIEVSIKDDIVSILNKPLESMPLLINDYTDIRMAFVKWRLTIAR